MSQEQFSEGLMPSMLDRLIDPESGGTVARRGYSMKQMMQCVRRDVEELLNTRQMELHVDDAFPNVQDSLITYGLPDFGSMSTENRAHKERLGLMMGEELALFEPRLKEIRAILIERPNDTKRMTLRFHIEAKMKVEPSPEVAFETVLELTTGQAKVKGG